MQIHSSLDDTCNCCPLSPGTVNNSWGNASAVEWGMKMLYLSLLSNLCFSLTWSLWSWFNIQKYWTEHCLSIVSFWTQDTWDSYMEEEKDCNQRTGHCESFVFHFLENDHCESVWKATLWRMLLFHPCSWREGCFRWEASGLFL